MSYSIDSEAFAHITGNSSFLESYYGKTGNNRVANGALVPIHGHGNSLYLSSTLPLSNVLHVPFSFCIYKFIIRSSYY